MGYTHFEMVQAIEKSSVRLEQSDRDFVAFVSRKLKRSEALMGHESKALKQIYNDIIRSKK